MINNSKDLVQEGERLIHEAILKVLLNHYEEGFGTGPKKISELIGLYRGEGEGKYHDGLVQGFLSQLLELKKVKREFQENGKGGWILTKKEYEFRH